MDEATQHYLNSLRAIAFPNGQTFVGPQGTDRVGNVGVSAPTADR